MNTKGPFNYASIQAGYYDEVFHRRKGPQSKWHHLKFAHVASLMKGARSHLDIGCGPGTFIGLLPPGVKSTGIDIAEDQIAFAGSRYGTDGRRFVRIDSLQRLPFEDGCFDVVTAVEFIEHLSTADTSAMLKECLRVLRPGGRIILTTPNYASLWPALEFVLNRVSPVSYEDQHISQYMPSKASAMLKEVGFSGVEAAAFLFTAPFWAVLNWGFSDRVNAMESGLARHCGFLLFAQGVKP